MKKAVVIGAGQTGRGYVPRFLKESGYDITLLDQDPALIRLLQEDKAYTIHFYSKDRTPLQIAPVKAYLTHTPESMAAIQNADLVFTSVGEQNLGDVAAQLAASLKGRKALPTIITVENGINPGRVLRNHLTDLGFNEELAISMTAVFCSTVKLDKTRLDILSMNETYFPYDCDALANLDFPGAVPVHNFEKFLQRKIYTYNCLAGLISYLGYVKGYEVYGDAANDPEVSELMDQLLADLNPALQDYFQITKEDQEEFAQRALAKMKNKDILDFNVKNGRAAKRKLSPTERIMSPLKILKEHNKDIRIMELVAAAALTYWNELQGNGSEPVLETTPVETFARLNALDLDDPVVKAVAVYYDQIQQSRSHIVIPKILEAVSA